MNREEIGKTLLLITPFIGAIYGYFIKINTVLIFFTIVFMIMFQVINYKD
jgi:uncharacterized membrane protein